MKIGTKSLLFGAHQFVWHPCVKFDPWWLYLPRVILTGEIKEYRQEAHDANLITLDKSNREWFDWARSRMMRKAYEKDIRPPYQEGS